ncbi:hypothetical protein Leryth_000103 [Lithospermum erythrorhizon]|nr:hypothetical protein Leryth_000103 [Lithospermum erythrorhizon]
MFLVSLDLLLPSSQKIPQQTLIARKQKRNNTIAPSCFRHSLVVKGMAKEAKLRQVVVETG